jgi:hypothetical protein
MGGVARAIPTMIKGAKMMDAGSSEQETKSYLESQGLKNIQIILKRIIFRVFNN